MSVRDIINQGYNKPRFQYKVMLTSRIKSSGLVLSDLGFEKPGCYLYLLIGTREWFLEHPETPGKWWDQLMINSIPAVECDETFQYTDVMTTMTLATIGMKPVKKIVTDEAGEYINGSTVEVTAFTSHFSNSGGLIMELLKRDLCMMAEHIRQGGESPLGEQEVYERVERLSAEVFQEHNLVEYYVEKLGFTPVPDGVLTVRKEDVEKVLEKGVVSATDIHIVSLFYDL